MMIAAHLIGMANGCSRDDGRRADGAAGREREEPSLIKVDVPRYSVYWLRSFSNAFSVISL
jgi:hypothetical protein